MAEADAAAAATATTADAATTTNNATADATQSAAATADKAATTTATLAAGGDGTASDKPAAAPADWPTDWRQKLAGEDPKVLKQLERMTSPGDVFKSYRALQQKLSSGELKAQLAKDATPEQIAAYRKEAGIPEKPDGYQIELPKGIVLGEADKPLVDSFTAAAHAKNWTPDKVNEALAWYYDQQDKQIEARHAQDSEFKGKAEDDLRAEFGPEYRANLNASGNFLAANFPEGLADEILTARTPGGRLLGDTPGFVKAIVALARELNPAATLVPANGGDPAKGLNDRITDIEKLMGDRASDYWRGPKANAMQQEYRDLITARDKMKARAA